MEISLRSHAKRDPAREHCVERERVVVEKKSVLRARHERRFRLDGELSRSSRRRVLFGSRNLEKAYLGECSPSLRRSPPRSSRRTFTFTSSFPSAFLWPTLHVVVATFASEREEKSLVKMRAKREREDAVLIF